MTIKELYDEMKMVHAEDYDIYFDGIEIADIKYCINDTYNEINFDTEWEFEE